MQNELLSALRATAVLYGALAVLTACSTMSSSRLQRFEFSRVEMALPFRIVLYAPSRMAASNAVEAAFARIHYLNDVLSDYDSDSELSRLSQTSGTGREVPVSEDLWRVLSRAQEIATSSGGAFDITVGPLVNIWRNARRVKRLPEPELLEEARTRVGYTNLVLNAKKRSARLLVPGMRIDVGGIGKGYALDEALKVLVAHGTPRALVTGGGDMPAGERPPRKNAWRMDIGALDVSNTPPVRFVLLHQAGLATSGDLFQRLEIEGKRYSHIVDPRTGLGLTDHSLVTIIAKNATSADGLSKVVSVLGPEKAFRIVEGEGAAAHVVRKPGEKIESYETRSFAAFYDTAGIP